MVPELRRQFNESFTKEKYDAFLTELNSHYPGAIEFRVAETPVFISKLFEQKMIEACESIIDVIVDDRFKELTERAIPPGERVPNESKKSEMIAFDFGICINDAGQLEPQLIEMQGFPTLYGFQVLYPEIIKNHFPIPANYSQYLGGLNRESYLQLLKRVVLGDVDPENVILLEIKPHEQKTRIDFYATGKYLGIQPVCITELIAEGRELFYMREGSKTKVKRIYNRVIFDELNQVRGTLTGAIDITREFDVQFVPHPNWFYRISKFTLPMIHHPYVPKTYFLNELKQLPSGLENYVLKPLFSFAGQGVIIDLQQKDLENIHDPENWILQKKVRYADVIKTPEEPAKVEIRIMYLWEDGKPRPQPAINLARLSKGKMIGVRYNKDKEWVGGSVAFFEQQTNNSNSHL